ncbi:ABC transporter substrate-binding protein [Lujinxingia vulgaris]|uniref:ABC transporter substrate-binding protein n=2 Tax=Lujinxingia vulgaris TaxID=2600176 RepID=A0A5C6XJ19_9DELT|nr:ABC transporter substrate-binding protein [Lujinxingia vulgaris]
MGAPSMKTLLALPLLAALALSSGCSLTLDLNQCTSDSDCAGDQTCSAEGLCAAPGEDEGRQLTGGPCQRLEGEPESNNPFLMGVVLQLSGSGAGFGTPMLESILMATNNINGFGGIAGRRIGLVVCDTQGSNATAREAAEHLVDNAGVSAIIGFNSSQTISISQDITVPNDVLLMSPSATTQTISGLADNDLVFRTAPNDEFQAEAFAELLSHTLETTLPDAGVAEPKLAIMVRRDDSYAEGLSETIIPMLPTAITSGGEDRFTVNNYTNSGVGEPVDYTGDVAVVASQSTPPDVVAIFGSAEAWELISYFEIALENQPLYFGVDAMKNAQLAGQANTNLEGRIWGTGPRNIGDAGYVPYLTFRTQFESRIEDDPDKYQFVANAFDAVYALAFAAAAEGFTGPELAQGLRRLSEGPEITPRAAEAQQAINTLSAGGSVTYLGASGPMFFDQNGDPQPTPISLWCFQDASVPEEGEIYSETRAFTPLTCSEPEG